MTNSQPKAPDSSTAQNALARFHLARLLRDLDLGPVYQATDEKTQASLRSLKVRLALARISHDSLHLPAELEALRKNLALFKGFSDSHILRIYEAIPDSEEELVSLEFTEGPSLAELVGKATLTVPEIVGILLEVCAGLEALYKLGFEPFGLSPRHILIHRDGSVKIDPLSAALIGAREVARYSALDRAYLADPEAAWILPHNDTYMIGSVGAELLRGARLLNSTGAWSRKINALWSVLRMRLRGFAAPSGELMDLLDNLRGVTDQERTYSIKEVKFSLAHIQAELQPEPPQLPRMLSRYEAPLTQVTPAAALEIAPKPEQLPADTSATALRTSNPTIFVSLLAIYLLAVLAFLAWLSASSIKTPLLP